MSSPDNENSAIMQQFIKNWVDLNEGDPVPQHLVQAVAETPGVNLKVREHGGIEIDGMVVGHIAK